MTLVILLAVLIGLLLGLLGGGGSILTVPVMVYLVGLEPKSAIATSLIVVGTTSIIAVIGHARHGRVCWKAGAWFGLAGMAGAYGSGRLAALIPGNVLLLLFAAIMLGTAAAMLLGRSRKVSARSGGSLCPPKLNMPAVLFDGFLVGGLNGLVGVGGGFVIVPALNILARLPMHAAIGTSLMVIAMNSTAALAGYASHVRIEPRITLLFTGAAIAGSLVGGWLSTRISGAVLRRGFGVFVIAVAGYLLHRELSFEVIAAVWQLLIEHRDFLWGFSTAAAIVVMYWLRGLVHHRDQLHGQLH